MHLLFAAAMALTQQWLLVSDLHLNPFDRSPAAAAYGSDTNWPLLRSAIAAMRKAQPQPQAIVIAGDLLAHQWSAKAQAARQDPTRAAARAMSDIARAFNTAFPRAQFVLALGNNDDPCGDYRAAAGTPYLSAVARAWEPLVNRHGASPAFARDFSNTGYYTALLPGGVRMVVLDDVYWSLFFRPCRRGVNAGNAQMGWLDQTLRSLKPGESAVPLMHIPPGVDAVSTLLAQRFVIVPYWRADARVRFTRELARFASRIPFALAGHTHRTDFRLAGSTPLLIAAAISPIYSNNAAFMTLAVGARGALENYHVFSFDPRSGDWQQTFAFNRAYGVHGFNLKDVLRVHERIESDPALRRVWELSTVSNSDAWYSVRASWTAHWCAQTAVGGQYSACAGDQRRTAVLPVLAGMALVLAVLVAVWYSRKRLWT
ncbi:MAG: metallophosphoesterase [Candidatus Baltobacteraceae bacterium]